MATGYTFNLRPFKAFLLLLPCDTWCWCFSQMTSWFLEEFGGEVAVASAWMLSVKFAGFLCSSSRLISW